MRDHRLPRGLNTAATFAALLLAACSGGESDGGTEPNATGALRVTVTTTGAELDPDGYTLMLDGTARGTIHTQADTLVHNIPVGSVLIGLSGMASNCTPTTALPVSITVVANQSATATINVSCSATSGSLGLTTVTSGADLDPNGYTYRIDAGAPHPLALNSTLFVTGVSAGGHTVTLTDIAGNCTALPGVTQPVTVVAGDTVTITFTISCAATTGMIHVTTTTTGAAPDPDGYVVALDGGAPQAIGAASQLDFPGVAPGVHSLTLSGLATNCIVAGANPLAANVTAGATTTTAFSVTCPAVGSMAIGTVTLGLSQDPNGYSATVDGGPSVLLRGTDTTLIANVVAGAHIVTITGIASNCTMSQANPRTVPVTANATTPVPVTITCSLQAGPRTNSVMFTRFVPDTLTGGMNYDIYAVAPDGTGLSPLITGPAFAQQASWAPNGSQIVYEYRTSSSDYASAQIRVRDANGSNDHLVGPGSLPAWSPDGSQIAYVNNGIYVMNADGSGSHKVSPGPPVALDNALFPTWSPDGSRIAYLSGGGDVAIVRADGTGAHGISPVGAYRPAWSPDGSRLVFQMVGETGIAVVNSDGTGYGVLLGVGEAMGDPTWSPDGTQLVVTLSTSGPAVLYRVNVNGTGLAPITSGAGADVYANWGR